MSSSSKGENSLGNGPLAASRMDLSGHERDKLWLSRAGKDMVDVSYLSGADGVEDGRVFARADLDRDGFEDLIVVNRNAPLLRVYRNRLGPATGNHTLTVSVVGDRARAGRDAVGARVVASACGVTQTREIAIGTGFAAVDGMAVTLGLGACDHVDELTVAFPRGEKRAFHKVAADAAYRVVEGKGIQPIDGLIQRGAAATTMAPAAPAAAPTALASLAATTAGTAPLVLVDLYATWCEACVRTAPRLDALLAPHVAAGELDAVGVSIEPTDDGPAAAKFGKDHAIGHALQPYSAVTATAVSAPFGGTPALPSILVLERSTGQILLQTRGIPTRSDLERVLWSEGQRVRHPSPPL